MAPTKTASPLTSLVSLRDARERSIARLTEAFAHDVLEMDEFERRLSIAHRTNSTEELATLTADLQDEAATATTALAVPAPVSPASVRQSQRLLLIMGGTSRRGQWTPARKLRIIALMGGADLDFREAALAPGVTEVHITAVMGGVNIVVPPHLAVEMDGSAILGGFEHSDRAPLDPDPERPVLRVYGLAVMGGVNIETRLLGESERDAHRRRRQGRRELSEARRTPALPPHRDES
jgi:hypothetical protein